MSTFRLIDVYEYSVLRDISPNVERCTNVSAATITVVKRNLEMSNEMTMQQILLLIQQVAEIIRQSNLEIDSG